MHESGAHNHTLVSGVDARGGGIGLLFLGGGAGLAMECRCGGVGWAGLGVGGSAWRTVPKSQPSSSSASNLIDFIRFLACLCARIDYVLLALFHLPTDRCYGCRSC